MSTEYLSTGQAAKLLSVTSDTVLKWVKKGRLGAIRTPGGHYRVSRRDVYALRSKESGKAAHYCWEHRVRSGGLPDGCLECLVYRSRAQRCYELALATRDDFAALSACMGDCGNCEYRDLVRGQAANVLVVTPDPLVRSLLPESASRAPFNVSVAASAYELSAMVESVRPDFVILDIDLGPAEVASIAAHLKDDPRVGVTRIVIAMDGCDLPTGCEGGVFAHIEKPLTPENLEQAFRELSLDAW